MERHHRQQSGHSFRQTAFLRLFQQEYCARPPLSQRTAKRLRVRIRSDAGCSRADFRQHRLHRIAKPILPSDEQHPPAPPACAQPFHHRHSSPLRLIL